MKPSYSPTPVSNRSRRIGRKALQADRLSRAVSKSKQSKLAYMRQFLQVHQKRVVLMGATIAIIGIALFSAMQAYTTQQVAAKKSEAIKAQDLARDKSQAADACRQKKLQEKADLVGKVTYDELYDGNECDK